MTLNLYENARQLQSNNIVRKHAFQDEFLEAQKRLTLEGNIVISVGLFGHSGDDEVWTEGTKEMLDDMHKPKIDMADEIFVINVGGYIGSSTRNAQIFKETLPVIRNGFYKAKTFDV